jgi:phage terminase Nu1 subunit (DNA packaging protein)
MHASPLAPIHVEPIPRLALRRPEMAEALGVSERTLSAWSDVPTVRIGGCVMYPVEQIRKWLADQAANQSNPKAETATPVKP